MEIKWFGTAAISYKHDGKTIIFDPFGGINKKLGCYSATELSICGNIFITHGHFDHLAHVPAIMALNKAKVYCAQPVAQSLINLGVDQSRIIVVRPGQNINEGPFKIRVLKGKHIIFDRKLVFQTIFNVRVIRNFAGFCNMLKVAGKFPEGQTLIYEINIDDKKILHMGSVALAEDEVYPEAMDILMLPFQGRSDLDSYTMPYIAKFKPKTIFLHHFDNTFPPLSNTINTEKFMQNIKSVFPEMKFVIPLRGAGIVL